MKMTFFWVPARDSQKSEEELNAFLAGHRVVQIEKGFASDENGPGWSICVQWVEGESEGGGPKKGKARVYGEEEIR